MLIWKTAEFKAHMVEQEDRVIKGKSTGKFAIHKSLGTDNKWSITHVPSGLKLTDRDTQEGCVKLIEELSRSIYGFTFMGTSRLKENGTKIVEVITGMTPEE